MGQFASTLFFVTVKAKNFLLEPLG